MSTGAVIFIDFDNVMLGLMSVDSRAAMRFAQDPSSWMSQLAQGATGSGELRWLMRRCYMNPSGSVNDPARPGERIYFSRLRPIFTSAGFEVIDCPALTSRSKNAADIRMVVDAMDALHAGTRYTEFVIVSSDADFTPLLQRMRAEDRRITVVSSGNSAAAYRNVADRVLDGQDLIDLLEGDDAEAGRDATPAVEDESPAADHGELREQFEEAVRKAYAEAEGPLNLAALSGRLRTRLGPETTGSEWFGAGSFKAAVMRIGLDGATFDQHSIWDERRHCAAPPTAAVEPMEIPPLIAQICAVTDLPKLSPEVWRAVCEALDEYARTRVFSLTEASKWTRDRVVERGHHVGRGAISHVLLGLSMSGRPLNSDPPPAAAHIAGSIVYNTVRRSAAAGLPLDAAEIAVLAAWIGAPASTPTGPEGVDLGHESAHNTGEGVVSH